MQHWKRTTHAANRLFEQGQLIDARELYLQALALAQVLFERWHDADEAVTVFVIAHHNLADLHVQLGQPHESADYLCAAHQRLLHACQQSSLPVALRAAALRHSARTYTELLGFIAEHGQYPRTERLLKQQTLGVSPLVTRAEASYLPPAYGLH